MRREVRSFVDIMETKLDENDDKTGWHDSASLVLWGRALEELMELYWLLVESPEKATEIGRAAADVANFMLFVADVRKALD